MNMAFPDRRTLNVLMTALLFGLVLAIVYVARAVIVTTGWSIAVPVSCCSMAISASPFGGSV